MINLFQISEQEVFYVAAEFGGYNLTLPQAQERCLEHGAELATFQQLQAAWELGWFNFSKIVKS